VIIDPVGLDFLLISRAVDDHKTRDRKKIQKISNDDSESKLDPDVSNARDSKEYDFTERMDDT